ncbi:SDR family oxidoreductase [Tsukamurella pseudospumae]|uniref:Short-chain dehydrogenase n=1 Tax=Tsukamurella pseudospumae TaxID=239498 RepID=A0A138AJU5_9ACTN|nr:SDR family oxidoreductase [Tsukamurella pseudospumae]KXO90567.1 short-chain dehydrogenase [Tsukamurella pseudospumae]KXP10776.1 short-chain dehydrogenase [Tsukamurella pseudospumae]
MVAIKDAVIVVTGGRRGLGAALVDGALARGARKVYATGREPFTDPRPEVVPVALEVRSTESAEALARLASDAEVVFNNAGIMTPTPLATGELADIEAMFDVNALGLLRVARAFAPVLAANGGGALVDMHSVLSWLSGSGGYGASKAAAWSITNSLRVELAAQNTQVVGVHAGFIDTDMVSAIPVPKATPDEIATAILDGVATGEVEILADEITTITKAALSGPVEALTFPAGA